MKYLVTSHKDAKGKAEIHKQGLYCYDLRDSDDGTGIATIEEFVFVNRVGSIITNEKIEFQKDDFIDYDFFEKVNENVGTIEELLTSKTKNKTRQLDDNMYVIDVGYRNKEPIALVQKTTKYGKEYIIGFNYEITDNKIQWEYGYYYDTDINKAKSDFKKVLAGENLADTFKESKKEENVMENDPNELKFYNETEIRNIIANKEELYFADDGIDEVIVKFEDIPDFIVDINRKQGIVDLKFYKMENDLYEPYITTMGEYLDKVKPEIREKIIDRLVKLQTGEIEPKEYKLIDENEFDDIKIKMKQEISKKSKVKRKIKEIDK